MNRRWWRARSNGSSKNAGKRKPSIYLQRQYEGLPIVYVACQPVNYTPGSGNEIAAIRRCGRTRGSVLQHLWLDTVSSVYRVDNAIANQVWDELFPDVDRIPPRRPTHFLEIGILTGHEMKRSPILTTAACFLSVARDSDYCAAEVASFLVWQFRRWVPEDFQGISPDVVTKQTVWLLQCIAAKWKTLRN